MNERRYHKEIGFPKNFDEMMSKYLKGISQITYSHHAKWETIKDRYHILPVFKYEWLKKEDCFEISVEEGMIIKAVFRLSDEKFDNSYSINNFGNVVTCWANDKLDVHHTLNTSIYETV